MPSYPVDAVQQVVEGRRPHAILAEAASAVDAVQQRIKAVHSLPLARLRRHMATTHIVATTSFVDSLIDAPHNIARQTQQRAALLMYLPRWHRDV
jgi:hypothetical protein